MKNYDNRRHVEVHPSFLGHNLTEIQFFFYKCLAHCLEFADFSEIELPYLREEDLESKFRDILINFKFPK